MEAEAYSVAFAASAKRDLAALPEKVVGAVVEFLYGSLCENPLRVGKPLRFELEGLHIARRGDCRIIYQVDDELHRVVVAAVGHRADVYR